MGSTRVFSRCEESLKAKNWGASKRNSNFTGEYKGEKGIDGYSKMDRLLGNTQKTLGK